MDSTNSEARDAESVAGALMDPDRAASLSGLDVLTMPEFVSVQDRDPSSTSQQPRKSSRRRKCSSPIRRHSQSGHPQSDLQSGHPQTVHPQYTLDRRHGLATPQPVLARRDIQLTPPPFRRETETLTLEIRLICCFMDGLDSSVSTYGMYVSDHIKSFPQNWLQFFP